jgi:hypothetical protein
VPPCCYTLLSCTINALGFDITWSMSSTLASGIYNTDHPIDHTYTLTDVRQMQIATSPPSKYRRPSAQGVVKALFDHRMLPRVLAGSSAGSIVASLIATRTDLELGDMFDSLEQVM